MRKLVAVLLVCLTSLACYDAQRAAADDNDLIVRVDNRYRSDVTVYGISDGFRFRICRVVAHTQKDCVADKARFVYRDVDFIIRPLAENSFGVRGELVGPTDELLELIVGHTRAHSTVSVWRD